MHILFLVYDYDPGKQLGGASVYIEVMAQAWKNAGHQVSVICRSTTQEKIILDHEGIRVVKVPLQKYPNALLDKIKFRLYGDNSIRGIYMKEFSYAALKEVETWDEKPNVIESSADLCWAFVKDKRIPVMVRIHGLSLLESQVDPENKHLKSKLIFEIEDYCSRNAPFVSTMSQYMASIMKKNNITIKSFVHNPLPPIPPSLENISKIKKQLVTVGRLVPRKRFDISIKVLAQLDAPWTLKVVGPDSQFGPEEKSYLEHLKELSRTLNVEDRVFFTGPLSREDTLKAIAESEIMIHASPIENMPYSIMEGLAIRTKVLACSEGGIPEILEGRGVMKTFDDITGFADAIKNNQVFPISDKDHRQFMKEHDASHIQQQLEDLYSHYK